MTPLEKEKLDIFIEMFGRMNANEALEIAVQADCVAKDCEPFPISYDRFNRERVNAFDYAWLLEKEANAGNGSGV